jgi:hypothetical protein
MNQLSQRPVEMSESREDNCIFTVSVMVHIALLRTLFLLLLVIE